MDACWKEPSGSGPASEEGNLSSCSGVSVWFVFTLKYANLSFIFSKRALFNLGESSSSRSERASLLTGALATRSSEPLKAAEALLFITLTSCVLPLIGVECALCLRNDLEAKKSSPVLLLLLLLLLEMFSLESDTTPKTGREAGLCSVIGESVFWVAGWWMAVVLILC